MTTSSNGVSRCVPQDPRWSRVEIGRDHLEVPHGLAFHATVPRTSIRTADQPARIPIIYGIGVHGWRGTWVVNGPSHDGVRPHLDPPARGRVTMFTVTLRELYLSLEEPERFAEALRR